MKNKFATTTNRRSYGYNWPWKRGYNRPKRGRSTVEKSVVLILVLTSLWWLSYDVLFLMHKHSVFGGLDTLVKHKQNKRDVRAIYTPPQHGHAHINIPAPPGIIFRRYVPNENSALSTQSVLTLELYPELVIPGLGHAGEPAELPDSLKPESMRHFQEHSFDSVLSDRISSNRHLKDYRGRLCTVKETMYPKDLPNMSVIICFHNEALSALLRTVHSLINNTPPQLLSSIILVDDASTLDLLEGRLEAHVKLINAQFQNKIRLIRNRKREGLVRSRLKGAEKASGSVLTFLDSHCEVTQGWAEPLLSRIKDNPKNVVCPVIEILDSKDFSYKNTETKDLKQVGSFTWDLFFDWRAISKEEAKLRLDETYPLKSPTMAGGLFSIDRSYFYELGTYDDQMDIWGGENLEMSFRIWMCGGNLEIMPCSRVGHIFRNKDSPYTFPGGVSRTLNKNFNRLAEVWMDGYKENYYRKKSAVDRNADIGDLTTRKELRKRLKCHSFDWYVKNIVPGILGSDQNPPARGEVRNIATGKCLDSMGETGNHLEIQVFPCHGMGVNQLFTLTKNNEIVFDDQSCLDYSLTNENNKVEMWHCHALGGNQLWRHDRKTGLIKHYISSKCLIIDAEDFLTVQKCDENDPSQGWKFSHYNGDHIENKTAKETNRFKFDEPFLLSEEINSKIINDT